MPCLRGGATDHRLLRDWEHRSDSGAMSPPSPEALLARVCFRALALAAPALSLELLALVYEVGKALGLVLGQMQVIGRPGLPAGDADGEPAGAGAESGDARDEGIEGMGSGEFRHGGDRLRNPRHMVS